MAKKALVQVRQKVNGESGMHEIDEGGVVLVFPSEEAFDKAIEILFDRQVAYMVLDELTLVVPSGIEAFLQKLEPERIPTLSANQLPPKELAALRREHLSFGEDL